MFTARKELVFWHKTPSLTYWLILTRFSLCFEIKANVVLEYSFHDKKTYLILRQMNFILEMWEGLRTSLIRKYHISTLSPFFQFTWGCFLQIFFSSLERQSTGSHQKTVLGAQSCSPCEHGLPERKISSIFQTGSSSRRRNIHPPTITPTTTEYLQKPANTSSALGSWCFLLETL